MVHLVDNLKKGEASLSWSYGEIDNLEVIQNIVNSSDAELKQSGFSDEDIRTCREQMDELKNKSDAELIEGLGIDESAVQSIRKAFETNEEFKRKAIEGNNMATLSGTLSSSEFYHSLYADRYSDGTYERKYRIRAGFNWIKAFAELALDDEIAIAWGGEFSISEGTITSQADYYYALVEYGLIPQYGTCRSRSSCRRERSTPDAGIVFSMPQRKLVGIHKERLKTGYVSFFIHKKKADGQVTNVVSQYLHKSIGLSSLSVSSGSIIPEFVSTSFLSDCNIVSINR